MKYTIVDHIQRQVDLNAEASRDLEGILVNRLVRKRQFIVQPGFACTHQTYVQKGSFRGYLVTADGTEHTVQFAIEDWFISDFHSYIFQEPATLFVEALEDSAVQQIEYSHVETLCKTHHSLEHFFRLVAQKSFAFSQKRILSNFEMQAEERFLFFKKQYPQIEARVPQYALASYLGISPEFLSKIKRNSTQST